MVCFNTFESKILAETRAYVITAIKQEGPDFYSLAWVSKGNSTPLCSRS